MQRKLSDLLKAAQSADADRSQKTQALEAATAAKATADAGVTSTHRDLAGAIRTRGGVFVDTQATPLMMYVVDEAGADYLPRPVAGPDDTIDVPDAEPPAPEAPPTVPPPEPGPTGPEVPIEVPPPTEIPPAPPSEVPTDAEPNPDGAAVPPAPEPTGL
jgi:hypothetical protein